MVRLLRDLRRIRVARVVAEAFRCKRVVSPVSTRMDDAQATWKRAARTLDTEILHLAHQEPRQQARADERPHRLGDLHFERDQERKEERGRVSPAAA